MSRKPGQVFGRWFTEYCKKMGIYRKSRDFHALRHTFKTQLVRQLKAHPLMVHLVMGHAQPDEMDVVYFHGFEPKDTAATLRALEFKDLDLSLLFKANQPNRRYMGITTGRDEDTTDGVLPAPDTQRAPPKRPDSGEKPEKPRNTEARASPNRGTTKRTLIPGKLRGAAAKGRPPTAD